MAAMAPLMPLGAGGLYTSWFQFSKTRDSVLPTYFGHRYEQDLRARQKRHALHPRQCHRHPPGARTARRVDHLDVATLECGRQLSR